MEKACCGMKSPVGKSLFVEKLTLYRPLVVIVSLSVVSGLAMAWEGRVPFMDGIMGIFLLFLAALKLFSLGSFADSFARYDLLAARSRVYALSYPFIELALGGLYLSGMYAVITNILTVLVMCVGMLGIIKVLRSKAVVQCACVGTGFNLPVGWVTLAENGAMALMAVLNLIYLHSA